MTTITQNDFLLSDRFLQRGIRLSSADANILRRAELTLRRWFEAECNEVIERDETGKPYRYVFPHNGAMHRYPIRDRESGALKRVRKLCEKHGLVYYPQTDPRGCALYVGTYDMLQGRPIEQAYTDLVPCCGGAS